MCVGVCVCVYVCGCVCVCVCVWVRWIMSFVTKLHMKNVRSVVTKLYTNKLSGKTKRFLHIRRTLLISCLQNRLGNVSISVYLLLLSSLPVICFLSLLLFFLSITSLLRISDRKILSLHLAWLLSLSLLIYPL
jgi:hypothetical protein